MKEELLFTPNSHKYKAEQKQTAEEKKVEKVVSGTVKTKKKSEIKKLTDVFVSEDASNVKSYILMDVLVPAVKKAISDIVTNGIDMILYGESGNKKKTSGSKVSYRSYYDNQSDRRTVSTRTRFDYDDIIVETRGEAEQIFDQMQEIIDTYGFVSVSDLYDMVDLTAPFTANKYGWNNIRSADAIRVSGGGYLLKLPTAKALD